MRGNILISFAAVSLISFGNIAYADHDLEGIWEDERNQIVLQIEKTKDGIRVQRAGQSRWYEYLEYRENQFRDSQGNTYYLLTDHTLEWEDQSGKKRLRFQKKSSNQLESSESRGREYQDRQDDERKTQERDNYVERNYFYGHQDSRTMVSTHSLNGKWINQTTGQLIVIKAKNNALRVRAHRGGWETFYRKDTNTFIDSHGNRYDARKNELTYTSRRRDFQMTFRRY